MRSRSYLPDGRSKYPDRRPRRIAHHVLLGLAACSFSLLIFTATEAVAQEVVVSVGDGTVDAVAPGAGLLTAAGFAQSSHDVAHDSRHSFAFPCH